MRALAPMLILCGTNRPDAMTRKISKHVLSLAGHCTQLNPAQYLDLADLKPDIFSPTCYSKKPDWFINEFQKPISEAKGILVVTPEYNGSFPGVLKYFIDMLEFPKSLKGIPCAFVGVAAGQFAALRAIEQLEMIFAYRQAHLYGTRLFLAGINNSVNEDGSLKGDLEERLKALVAGFAKFADSLR